MPRLPPLLHAHQHRHRLASHSTWPQMGNPRRTRGDARLSVRQEHLRHHRRPWWPRMARRAGHPVLLERREVRLACDAESIFLLAHRLWISRDDSSAHRHQSEPGSSSKPCSPDRQFRHRPGRSRTPPPSWCSAQPFWPPCAERPQSRHQPSLTWHRVANSVPRGVSLGRVGVSRGGGPLGPTPCGRRPRSRPSHTLSPAVAGA